MFAIQCSDGPRLGQWWTGSQWSSRECHAAAFSTKVAALLARVEQGVPGECDVVTHPYAEHPPRMTPLRMSRVPVAARPDIRGHVTLTVEGVECLATVYATARPSGRRVIVRDRAGQVRYDSDDCCSLSDALRGFEQWAEGRQVVDPLYTPAVAEAVANPDEFVEGMEM